MFVRKTSRRQFLKLAGTMAGGALLAACSPAATSAPTQAPAATSAGAATQVPSGPTAMPAAATLSTNEPNFGPGSEPIIAAYNKVLQDTGNSWLTIKYEQADTTTLETRMAAGDAPDLIYVYPELAQPWAARKTLTSLTSAINADPGWKADADAFIAGTALGNSYKGELYAVTTAAEPQCVAYNPDQFKKHNVPTPAEVGKDAFTLDKFTDLVKQVSDDSMKGYYTMPEFGQGLGDILAGKGGNYFSEDGKTALLTSPEFVETVQYHLDLVKSGAGLNGVQSNKDGQWVAAALGNRLVASVMAGDWAWGWALKTQLDKKEFTPELYLLPAGPKGRHGAEHTAGIAISSATKQMDAALKFVRLAFTKAFQQVAAEQYEVSPRFPGRVDAADSLFSSKLLPDFYPQLFDGWVPMAVTPVINPNAIFGYMDDTYNAMFKGTDTRSVADIQADLQKRVQSDLDAAASTLP
jgi:ABC-type glycerol-3-phosphate transport system substrate-binding protein